MYNTIVAFFFSFFLYKKMKTCTIQMKTYTIQREKKTKGEDQILQRAIETE